MGHITKLRINHQAGSLAEVSELEGSMDTSELMEILEAVNRRSHADELALFAQRPETAQVPRSSMEVPAGEEADREQHSAVREWRKRFELSESMYKGAFERLDAARGAVRILATAVGIQSGIDSDVAKLAKQAHGRVSSMSSQYYAMVAELDNLRGAMSRIQMPDVPQAEEDMELPKQCQQLAHHMDVLKRTGFAVVPEEAREGVHVHGPQTREERFEKLKVAQQEATRMMIDLATIDGFVTKDTPAAEVMTKTMAWSIAIDNERKAEEGVKQGSPTRGDPKEGVTTRGDPKEGVTTLTHKYPTGLDVKIKIETPDDPALHDGGVAKSVAELIGVQVKGDLEEIEKDLQEIDKAELEGGEDASEVD